MNRLAIGLGLILLVLWSASAPAHEMRPAYLDIREMRPDEFAVLWKVPALGDMRLSLYARLPGTCRPKAEPISSIDANAFIERWPAGCSG